MERGNYRSLELIVLRLDRENVNIGDMHFEFSPGHGTTDAIFLVRKARKVPGQKEKVVLCIC